jgi:thiol-disulfide isomerase/thioredoxin
LGSRRRRGVSTAPARRLAALLVAAALGWLTGCGQAGPALPAGYHLARDASLGFQVGLAPGWREVGREQDGVDYADASGRLALLVEVSPAASTDAAAAAGAVVARVTGGTLGDGAESGPATLSGLPGRRLGGVVTAGGVAQAVEAAVALQGTRAWALVLTGPADSAQAARRLLDRTAPTFVVTPARPAAGAHAAVGQRAPGFAELDAIEGPVVLNFFATWCAPCRTEMPMLAGRAADAGGRFTVLGVDTRDDPSQVPAYAGRLGVRLPIAYDASGQVGQAYRVVGLPSTFFLDSHHVVRASALGPLTDASLASGLRAAGR